MLYKTHQKYGLLSGLLGIPLFVSIGLIPIITKGLRFHDVVLILFLLLFSQLSALFGSEFPDCDSYGGKKEDGTVKKGSVPSQKHPFISGVFRSLGIKHRGKFSHDYVSLTAFFGAIWIAQYFIIPSLQNRMVLSDSRFIAFGFNAFAMFLLTWLSRELAMKYTFQKKKRKHDMKMIQFLIIVSLAFVFYLLTLSVGLTTLNVFSPLATLKTVSFVGTITNISVLFVWLGAMSHLFADMMTNEGVYIFGFKISPAKLVIRLNKLFFLPSLVLGAVGYYLAQTNGAIMGIILGMLVFYSIKTTDLKTGSKYEDMCYLIVSFLCIPALILSVISITGGDVIGFIRMLGLIK